MKNGFYFAVLLTAGIFLAGSLQAATDGPGSPSKKTAAAYGGPNASPVITMTSMARNLGEIALNTSEAADNTNKALGLLNALHESRHQEEQARAAYMASEERFSLRQDAVMRAHEAVGRPTSHAATMILSSIPTKAATGLVGDAVTRVYATWPPGQATPHGRGGTALQAYDLLLAACQARCLDPHDAQQLAQAGRYGSCSSDPNAGQCTRTASLISAPQGIAIGPGQPHTKTVGVLLAMATFGPSMNAQMTARNYTSVRQLVQADVKQYFAMKEGKKFAGLDEDQAVFGTLLHKVSTENAAQANIQALQAVGVQIGSGPARDALLECIAPRASMPGGGTMYDAQCAQAEARGEPCQRPPGFTPSQVTEARAQASAFARQADVQGAATQNEGARIQGAVMTGGVARGLALARAQAGSRCPPVAHESLGRSLEHVASVIMTPEYNAFVASLTEEEVNERIAYVKKQYDMLDVQIAENYRDYTRELNGGATAFAENKPSLKDMFSNANVNLDTLNSGGSPFVSNDEVIKTSVKATLISTDSLK
jgi:hypothetical protein